MMYLLAVGQGRRPEGEGWTNATAWRPAGEVYYRDDGSVWTWTEDAITLFGFDQDDLEWRLQEMMKALQRPVLEYDADPPSVPGEHQEE